MLHVQPSDLPVLYSSNSSPTAVATVYLQNDGAVLAIL